MNLLVVWFMIGSYSLVLSSQVMQEAFRIITEYFLPPYDLQRRVGAMYILYSLYTTQPHVPKFKVGHGLFTVC